jgi:hypothetical protein
MESYHFAQLARVPQRVVLVLFFLLLLDFFVFWSKWEKRLESELQSICRARLGDIKGWSRLGSSELVSRDGWTSDGHAGRARPLVIGTAGGSRHIST